MRATGVHAKCCTRGNLRRRREQAGAASAQPPAKSSGIHSILLFQVAQALDRFNRWEQWRCTIFFGAVASTSGTIRYVPNHIIVLIAVKQGLRSTMGTARPPLPATQDKQSACVPAAVLQSDGAQPHQFRKIFRARRAEPRESAGVAGEMPRTDRIVALARSLAACGVFIV